MYRGAAHTDTIAKDDSDFDISYRSLAARTLIRLAHALYKPASILQAVGRRVQVGSFDLHCDLDISPYPAYAYGVQQAVALAKRLGVRAISVIEFGVAGGQGLIELERLAAAATRATGISVYVYGFDRGRGLAAPLDYRDVPYKWQAGFYEMDIDALKARIKTAELVLGDVAVTVSIFLEARYPVPIGFVAFDLDYYSSTITALELFRGEDRFFLPRILSYFDNTVVGNDYVLQNDYVGELRAIREFNENSVTMKLCPINGLSHKRPIPAMWNDAMYALHRFEHPDYCTYVGPPEEQQLPVRLRSLRRRTSILQSVSILLGRSSPRARPQATRPKGQDRPSRGE